MTVNNMTEKTERAATVCTLHVSAVALYEMTCWLEEEPKDQDDERLRDDCGGQGKDNDKGEARR
jgi:hypothetical protein